MGNGDWKRALQERLDPTLEASAHEWLTKACESVRRDATAFAGAFAEAGRRVGRGALVRRSLGQPLDEVPALDVAGLRVPLHTWRRADAARALLVAADAVRDEAGALKRLATRYWHGDSDERTSAVRLLGLLPEGQPRQPLPAPPVGAAYDTERDDDGPTHALRALLDSFRTNIVPLFDAATAGNPFFTLATPELEFNKAVLKRVFVDLPLEPVLALRGRANAELTRMLLNLAEEREVTLRAYPHEVWPVIAGHPVPGMVAKMIGLLEHPDDRLRLAAAEALATMNDPRAASFAEDRLARESQEPVRQAIRRLLSRTASS